MNDKVVLKKVKVFHFPLGETKFSVGEKVGVHEIDHHPMCIGTVIGVKWDEECPCPYVGYHYWIAVPWHERFADMPNHTREEIHDVIEIYLAEPTLIQLDDRQKADVLDGLIGGHA